MKIVTSEKQTDLAGRLGTTQYALSRALNFKINSIAAMRLRAIVLTKYNGFLIK